MYLLQDVSLGANSELVSSTKTISILELLTEGSTIWVILPLFVFSIITVYIFVERFLAIQRVTKLDEGFLKSLRTSIMQGQISQAKSLCASTSGPYARMLEKGIARIGKPLEDIRIAVENVGRLETYKLEKNLATLATIAGAAPMIGFLGTVLGMIITFHDIKSGGQAVQIDEMSGGIMQALVTTVAGLVIGIVAYVAYNLLVAKTDKVVHNMESATLEFMDILQEPA